MSQKGILTRYNGIQPLPTPGSNQFWCSACPRIHIHEYMNNIVFLLHPDFKKKKKIDLPTLPVFRSKGQTNLSFFRPDDSSGSLLIFVSLPWILPAACHQRASRIWRSNQPLLREIGYSAIARVASEPPGVARCPEGGSDEHDSKRNAKGMGCSHVP